MDQALSIRGRGVEAEDPLVVGRPERRAVTLVGELLQSAPIALHRGTRRGHQGQFLLIEIGAWHVGNRDAIADDDDPISQAKQFLELGRNNQDRRALRGDVAEDRIDRGAGADIDALRSFVENQHLRLQQEPARDDDLLLHAARKIEQVRISEPFDRQVETAH